MAIARVFCVVPIFGLLAAGLVTEAGIGLSKLRIACLREKCGIRNPKLAIASSQSRNEAGIKSLIVRLQAKP
jgi:hypothetical protein